MLEESRLLRWLVTLPENESSHEHYYCGIELPVFNAVVYIGLFRLLNLLAYFVCSLWQEQPFGQPEHFPPQRDFPARLSLYIFLPARNKTAATTSEIITVDIISAFQKEPPHLAFRKRRGGFSYTLSFSVSFVLSLYGLTNMNTMNANTSTAKISPTTFTAPVNSRPN